MTGFFIDQNGGYYEGDRQDSAHESVDRRPSDKHVRVNGAWVYVQPVPTTVTMRQAQRALYDAGLLASVEAAIASFPGTLGDKARIDWRTAQEVKRSDPIVQALIPSLGLTEPQLDALFTAAAAIQ